MAARRANRAPALRRRRRRVTSALLDTANPHQSHTGGTFSLRLHVAHDRQLQLPPGDARDRHRLVYRAAMWRVLAIALLSCQPKQPLQPSFFTQKRAANAPLTCSEALDCYAQCKPLVEECMLRCDQRSESFAVQRSRAVANCSARNSCSDLACERELCSSALDACTSPKPMQPAPIPAEPRPPGPVSQKPLASRRAQT
jgi:hypothetical protein